MEESVWKRRLSPQPSGIDDDGNASDDSCGSIRAYLKNPTKRQTPVGVTEIKVQGRQKNEDSWLLSQSSTAST
jgi:hypothetical protein